MFSVWYSPLALTSQPTTSHVIATKALAARKVAVHGAAAAALQSVATVYLQQYAS